MKTQILGLILSMCQVVAFTAVANDQQCAIADREKATDANEGIAVITGHGAALPEEYVVRLFKWEEDGSAFVVATDTIANGQFRFEQPVGEGLSVYSFIFDYHALPNTNHKLFVRPGAKIEIEAIDNYSYTWPVESNVPEQAEYELFTNYSKELWRKRQDVSKEYDRKRNKETLQALDSINRLIDLREIEFLKTRPVSAVWLDKAKRIAKSSISYKIDTADLKSMFANLDDSIKNSQIGKTIYGYLHTGSPLVIGDKFPDTGFYDLDGNVHELKEFQGKWCLVDFWNSGCAPCIMALPELRELKEKYPDNLELVSMSIEADNLWRQSSKDFPQISHNWNEGKADYGVFRRLGTNGFPTFAVVAPDGTIKDVWLGYSTGSLKRRVGFYLRPKGTTEYAESNGLRSVQFPQYAVNKTDRVLDIDRIEIDDEGTKVFFSFIYAPEKWIAIPQEAYLSDSEGTHYAAVGSDGITLGERLYPDKEGNGSFSITFQPLPEAVTSIDFHESASKDGWSIEGIRLTP